MRHISSALVLACVWARAVPTVPQLQWQGAHGQQGAIIHYNMATMIGTQGCGNDNWVKSSDPLSFKPSAVNGIVDTDSWARAMVAANMTYAVYVAKHNCGFTTWPTKATLPDGSPYGYSIQNSSCPDCDVVRDFVASCKKYGIKPGFYYSIATNIYLNVQNRAVQPGPLLPGQANVTQKQFEAIALFQLEELWSTYGADIEEVWFDGGLISGDPDFSTAIINLKNTYIPNAVAFNGWPYLPNSVRWLGDESGLAPDPMWSTGSCDQGLPVNGSAPPENGDPNSPYWCPAEVDSTLQQDDTWFYVDQWPLHSLSELVAMYHASLGRNSNWIFDIAPPPNGTVAPTHAAMYEQLGAWIRACYDVPLASGTMPAGASQLNIVLARGTVVDRIRLAENQVNGQIIHNYTVTGMTSGGWVALSNGTSVGAGKIDIWAGNMTLTAVQITTDAPPAGLQAQLYLCSRP